MTLHINEMVLAGMLVLTACRAGPAEDPETPQPPPPQTGDATGPDGGTWLGLRAESPPMARAGHTAVWSGQRMLVFGGEGKDGRLLGAGGAYSTLNFTWRPMSGSNAPAPRSHHAAVWTDAGMVVWGGLVVDLVTGQHGPTDTGGVYAPATGAWRPTSRTGAPAARRDATAVSTGPQMIVWGGDADGALATGGVYDPALDAWKATNETGAPSARYGHGAVWTGSKMLVWGGASPGGLESGGAAYDPAADKWAPITTAGAPGARMHHTAVWTADRMVVWGGVGRNGQGEQEYLKTGGVYDPGTDQWVSTAEANAPAGRVAHTAVGAMGAMIVYGGNDHDALAGGGLYIVAKDEWRKLPARDDAMRTAHTAVWAEDEMIMWGGYSQKGEYLDTGAVYKLPQDL